MDRFDVAMGYNVAMLEWGHYARQDALRTRYGFRAGLDGDTHAGLIRGGDETRGAHRAYHVASRIYASAPRFDPYDARGPRAQDA